MATFDEKQRTSSDDDTVVVQGDAAQHSPDTSSLNSKDVDDTYDAYKEGLNDAVSPVEAKTVLRKIDLRILPIVLLTYGLQYLDKQGINFASVFGLETANNLKGQDYSWTSSIFYFGYLIAQYPGGYAMQRLPIGKYLAGVTIIQGIIVMTTAGCSSFGGLATNRFFLGMAEASINPGFVMLLSMWYTSAEQPFRLEAYYSMLGVATMFGGLLAYAIGHIHSTLQQWQYIFLIFGAISILCGVYSLLCLPDLPSTAKFLSVRERTVAVHRTAANRQGVKNKQFKLYQVQQAVLDPKTYMLLLICLGGSLPNAAITSFASIIIKTFGYSTLGTQYMQIPGGAIQFVGPLIGGYLCTQYSGRLPIRTIVMAVGNALALTGAAMLVGLPSSSKWGRLVGLWLCYFQSVGFSLSFTVISSNMAGYTKKSVTASAYFTMYCVGNIVSPQTFRTSEAPGYHTAYIVMLVGYSLKLVMVLCLYWYMRRENIKRDKADGILQPGGVLDQAKGLTSSNVNGMSPEEKEAIEKGMRDCTEIDNPGFRYIL